MQIIKNYPKNITATLLLIFFCCPGFLKTVLAPLYLFCLTLLLIVNLKDISISCIKTFFLKRPGDLLILFWIISSIINLFLEPQNINYINYLGKIIFALLTYSFFYFWFDKKKNIFLELKRLYKYLLLIANTFFFIQVISGIRIFNVANERQIGILRIGTPLGGGYTVYGLLSCLFVLLIIGTRSFNKFDIFLSFISLFASAQRSSFIFIFILIIFLILELIKDTKYLQPNYWKIRLNKIYKYIIFSFIISLIIFSLISLITPYIFTLYELVSNLANLSESSKLSVFSRNIWEGTSSIPWRFYEHGIYLTNQCIDENPIKFLLFGCNSGQLGPVFGFNTGGQAHNTFFEIILRIGLIPSFLIGLFLIYKKPFLKNIFLIYYSLF